MAELINGVAVCQRHSQGQDFWLPKTARSTSAFAYLSSARLTSTRIRTACSSGSRKEERERKDKRTYVGRGKAVVFRPSEPTPDQVADLPVAEDVDDLPF